LGYPICSEKGAEAPGQSAVNLGCRRFGNRQTDHRQQTFTGFVLILFVEGIEPKTKFFTKRPNRNRVPESRSFQAEGRRSSVNASTAQQARFFINSLGDCGFFLSTQMTRYVKSWKKRKSIGTTREKPAKEGMFVAVRLAFRS
jgi:hypothetical protein